MLLQYFLYLNNLVVSNRAFTYPFLDGGWFAIPTFPRTFHELLGSLVREISGAAHSWPGRCPARTSSQSLWGSDVAKWHVGCWLCPKFWLLDIMILIDQPTKQTNGSSRVILLSMAPSSNQLFRKSQSWNRPIIGLIIVTVINTSTPSIAIN